MIAKKIQEEEKRFAQEQLNYKKAKEKSEKNLGKVGIHYSAPNKNQHIEDVDYEEVVSDK